MFESKTAAAPRAAWPSPELEIAGILHISVAFDWGDEIDLVRAQQLVPARPHVLSRRPRTPRSISYRPPPLEFGLPAVSLCLPELGEVRAGAKVMVFDFAGVSLSFDVSFRLPAAALLRLASGLAEPESLVQAARSALEPLYRELLPAMQRPAWSDLSEEYFVFQFLPGDPLPPVAELLETGAGWLAGLLRLDAEPLCPDEMAEALRRRLSYTHNDLLAAEWPAAVLIDRDCEETLEVIEFANLQLLEFRHTDNRLDEELSAAYGLIHSLARSWLPFWRTHTRPLRKMGDLRIEANAVLARTNNVLKLVGDQYLARVYRLLASRFHLEEWSGSIEHSLDVVEGVYQVLSDQAASYRIEFLEIIVIGLILLEIVMMIGH